MKMFFGSALCAAVLLCLPGAAFAGPFDIVDPYVNICAGTFHSGQIAIDDVTGRLGARFGSYFGIEGEASIGLDRDHFIYTPHCIGLVCPMFRTLGDAKLDNAEAGYAVGFLPVAPNADLFVRVGYGDAHFSAEPAIGGGFDQQGVKFGAGAQYFIDGSNGLRFDYVRTQFQNASYVGSKALGDSANEWSLALTHQF